MTSLLMVTRTMLGGYPEAELATVEVVGDAVSLTLDDGEQIVFVEEELDRALVEGRQAGRRVA